MDMHMDMDIDMDMDMDMDMEKARRCLANIPFQGGVSGFVRGV